MTYDLMLNMAKSGIKPRIKVSQYDNEIPQLRITLFDQNQSYAIPSGATVYISGTKKDNTGFQYECTVNDNIITAPITNQMTVFSGDVECEINIVTSGGKKSTENFILEVEKSALEDDVIISETDIPAIQRLSQPASTTQLGVVKVDGTSVTIDEDGTLHSSTTANAVRSVNNKTPDANGNVTLTASDVDALPSSTAIPDELSDLNDDSTHRLVTDTEKQAWNGKSTVSVTQIKSSGEKIATINVNGTDTDLYASAGGGGGGAVDSVNGMTGDVVLDVDDINDVDINNLADGQTLVYDATSGKWVNGSGGGGTSDYSDLTNKPQINGVTLSGNKTSGDLGIFTPTITSPTSGQVIKYDGSKWINSSVSGGGSNPNLLDNAWFTVNQKGFTSVSNFSGTRNIFDRWKSETESGFNKEVELINNTIKMTVSKDASQDTYCQVMQTLEQYNRLIGKKVTVSCKVNGTIYSFTTTVVDEQQNYTSVTIENNIVFLFIIDMRTSSYRGKGTCAFLGRVLKEYSGSEYEFNISATKLEFGEQSTLALDVEPNYTTELLKCQRYYKRFSCPNAYDVIATGMSYNGTSALFVVSLSVPMRTAPTMNVVGSFEVVTSGNHAYYVSSNNPLYMAYLFDRIKLSVACSGISDASCFLCSGSADSYIEFNAEL